MPINQIMGNNLSPFQRISSLPYNVAVEDTLRAEYQNQNVIAQVPRKFLNQARRRTLTNTQYTRWKRLAARQAGPGDKSQVTSGWLQNNECGRTVRKGQSLAGIGFRGGSGSLVSVHPVKYAREYERPFICRLSVSPCYTLRRWPPRQRLPSVSCDYHPRTGCSPFLSQSNLTRMAAMHTYGSIRTDLAPLSIARLWELLKLPTALVIVFQGGGGGCWVWATS